MRSEGDVRSRPGTKFVGRLFPGERVAVLPDGGLLITHPERRPQLIPRGEIRVLARRESGDAEVAVVVCGVATVG